MYIHFYINRYFFLFLFFTLLPLPVPPTVKGTANCQIQDSNFEFDNEKDSKNFRFTIEPARIVSI